MSSIEKLSIRGIRSFSPNREEIIEFYHPLTVILGDNGSGKTTIIECLKIACTGSLPPGARSGQSFIHDPRIAGTNEVKASVRLRFRNRAGKPMVVQRTFQLLQQKNTTRYKALDGAIRVVNGLGEKVSMSHKCAELDQHIPEMLGVSKAILESVIFCHQEESNWPLQEGSVLKKRFDDIFESARYTKALDAIKKLKKARSDNAKDFKRDLDVLNVKLKTAEEIKEKIEQTERKLKNATDEVAQFDEEVENAQNTLNEFEHLHNDIKKEGDTLELLRTNAARKEQDIQEAYSRITLLMSDSDEQLWNVLNNIDSHFEDQERVCRSLEQQSSQLNHEQKEARKKYETLCSRKGLVEGQIQIQQKNVTVLLALASEMGVKYQFHCQPVSSQEGDLKSFMSKFEHFVGEKTKTRELTEVKNQSDDDQFNSELTKLKSELHHAKEQLKMKQQELGAMNVKKRNVAAKLSALSSEMIPSPRDITEAEKLIEEASMSLQKFREQHDFDALADELDVIRKDVNEITFEVGQLNKKIELLEVNESALINLDSKRQECREKEQEFLSDLNRVVSEHRDLVHDDIPADENTLQTSIRTLQDLLAQRKAELDEKKSVLSDAEAKLQENLASSKHIEKQLADIRVSQKELERGSVSELKKLIDEISPGESIANVEDVLQKAKETYFTAKDKTLRCKNTITFLNIFKEKGVKEKCCPLCVRGLSQADEDLFVRTINEKTDDKKVKEKIRKAEIAEEVALNRWKAIESQVPNWRRLSPLEDQIAKYSKELDALYVAKRSLQGDVSDAKQAVSTLQTQVRRIDEGIRAFSQISSIGENVRRLRIRITNEEERLRSANADAETLGHLRSSRADKQSRLNELNRHLQSKQDDRQHAHDMHTQLLDELNKRKDDKSRLDQLRTSYDEAISEQASLQDDEKALREKISKLSEDEVNLVAVVRRKEQEMHRHRQEVAEKLRLARSDEQECLKDLISVKEQSRKVDEQAGENLERTLKKIAEDIAQTRQREITTAQSLEEISAQVEQARSNLAQHENTKRQVRDNLDYRRLKKELEELHVAIESQEAKLSSLPALDDVSRKVRAAKATVDAAKDERSTLRGRQQMLEEQIRELKIKLKSSELRNVDEKYRQKLIQFETTTMAVADLDKYYKALDQSLLQYHSKKVEEINSIIKSLWQITYKGQDIDTIELVSGQDMNTGGTKAARSYDYRVVMKKGGALIDMRGRCSAGQKVLAALVIRLALAETFCLNCGILALDEPTTNLDTENKLGLAQAITDILNARAGQQNFQLVCITHDEEFVQMLSEAQAMDGSRPEYYWRVSREDIGNNKFCSKIERREWRDGI